MLTHSMEFYLLCLISALAFVEEISTDGDLEQSTPSAGDTNDENTKSQEDSELETMTESTPDETTETNPDISEEVVSKNNEPEPEDLVIDAQLNRMQDLNQILEGVEIVGLQDANVGILAIFGKNAFPLLVGLPYWENSKVPIAGAARVGKGRVVTFSHQNFFRAINQEGQGDTGKLILNCIEWAANRKNKKSVQIFYEDMTGNAIFEKNFRLPAMLKTMETKVSYGDPSQPLNLTNIDVLVIPDFFDLPDTEYDTLLDFVKNGGASLIAFIYAGRREFKGNAFLQETGMVAVPFATKMAHSLTKDNGSAHFGADREFIKFTDGYSAVQEILKIIKEDNEEDPGHLPQIESTLKYIFDNVDHSKLTWLSGLKKSLDSLEPIIPSEENPVNVTDLLRLRGYLEGKFYTRFLEPVEIKAHPSATLFPGAVDEKRIDKKPISITISVMRGEKGSYALTSLGFSTLLYAPPGKIITLTIKGGIELSQFQVKIGCHIDYLGHLEEWKRFPSVTTQQTFEGETAIVASPFGGLIYIQDIKPLDENLTLSSLTLELTGAITTPSFVLGKTTTKDWNSKIRKIDAPWAEFVSDNLILSIPGELAKSVEKPEELMTVWNSIITRMSELIGLPPHVHRIAFDIQIAAGYMHAGVDVPIMAHLGSAKDSVNVTILTRPLGDSWAFYHELGHNHQHQFEYSWTLEGGQEVSNQLFAMYMLNHVYGFPIEETHYGLFMIYDRNNKTVKDYIKSGLDYRGQYLNDPYLKNIIYVQLIQKYGWDAFKKVFRAYKELKEYPKNEEDKIDKWIEVFSTVVEENISDLYKSYGVPFSPAIERELEKFPYSELSLNDLPLE